MLTSIGSRSRSLATRTTALIRSAKFDVHTQKPEMATAVEPTTSSTEGGITKSVYKNGRFWNPFDTHTGEPNPLTLFKFMSSKSNSNVPSQRVLNETLPIVTPDAKEIATPPETGIRLTWIGHATVLAQFDGVSVLTDPIFTDRCGMFSWQGPKRFRPVPLKVDELPKIDAVVISHSHYDHLSQPTVRELNKKFGKDLHWFVPLKLGAWMKAEGCETVTELDWWEEAHMDEHPGVMFACTPTQHWGMRNPTDRYKVLWGSWLVKGPNHSFYFAGDTAYCNAFKEIGQRYGPIDVAAIPVGATEPRWFMKYMHCNIPEAVQMHQDLNAKKSLAIHWGTFNLSHEYYLAPLTEIKENMEKAGLAAADFCTKKHGEIWHLFADNMNEMD